VVIGAVSGRGPDGVWAPSRRLLTVGLVATVTLFASESLALSTVMPKVAAELGRSGYGPAFSAFFLGQLVGTMVGGRAADRFGPARPFATAALAFAAGLVVGGTAHHVAVLIAGRVLQGVGAGAATPIEYTVVGRLYPAAARARMFAVTSTAWVLPGLFGPAVAGLVAQAFGWRWVFLGLLPFVIAAVAVTLPAIRHVGPAPGATGGLAAGPALVLAGGSGLVLAASTTRPVVLQLVLLAIGVTLFSRVHRRFVPAGALRLRRGLPATMVARLVLTFSFLAADSFVPYAVTSIRHRSLLTAAVAVMAPTVAWSSAAWVADRVLRVRPVPWLVVRGFAVLGVGLAGEMLLLAPSVPLALGIVGGAVAGTGIGLAFSPLSVHVLTFAEPGSEGRVSSSLSLFDALGYALGPAVSGFLLNRSGWSPAVALATSWSLAALAALAGTAVAARLIPVR
jgi:MFS family permease